jgi:hypothetical protein
LHILERRDPPVKKVTVNLSCRLDKTVYELLLEDSRAQNISLNSLINMITKRYISWERYADEIGFVPLAKETVRRIFEELDETKMQQIASHLGKTIPREFILLMFNKLDFNTVVSFIEITASRYGMLEHKTSGTKHDLILHHGISKKFSDFIGDVVEAMAKDLDFKVDVHNSDRNILFLSIEPD